MIEKLPPNPDQDNNIVNFPSKKRPASLMDRLADGEDLHDKFSSPPLPTETPFPDFMSFEDTIDTGVFGANAPAQKTEPSAQVSSENEEKNPSSRKPSYVERLRQLFRRK